MFAVVERRRLVWTVLDTVVEVDVDAERSGPQWAHWDRFAIEVPTSAVADDPLTAVARARAATSRSATLDRVPVATLALAQVAIDFEQPDASVLRLRAVLTEALPPPFAPMQRDDRGTSFEEAAAFAQARGMPIVATSIREGEGYWFFRVRHPDSVGVVVDRVGRVTVLGGGWDVDTWLWGYERGLASEEVRDLVVTAINDLPATVAALRQIAPAGTGDDVARLATLPAVFPRAVSWRAIEALRSAGDAFAWRLA